MMHNLPEPPVGDLHFRCLEALLRSHWPFTFVRFSDGEMEIVRNERLVIGDSITEWRKGNFKHSFPQYDRKTFEPKTHGHFREDLLASAERRHVGYFKGVPASHNKAVSDRDLMVALNGESLSNLTFADLFLNENYPRFMTRVVPIFSTFIDVVVVGNYRMKPSLMQLDWKLVAIPDNFFNDYYWVKKQSLAILNALPTGSLVLSAASSLSNVVGAELSKTRPDITFLDVGTTLHGLMGMHARTRQYHVDLEPWRVNNAHKKIKNRLSHAYHLKW